MAYLQWSQSVTMFICGKGKYDFLSGASPQPTHTDPTFRMWKSENSMVMSWLINSSTQKIGENFLLYTTVKDIWDAALDTYSSKETPLNSLKSRACSLTTGWCLDHKLLHRFSPFVAEIGFIWDIRPEMSRWCPSLQVDRRKAMYPQISVRPQSESRWGTRTYFRHQTTAHSPDNVLWSKTRRESRKLMLGSPTVNPIMMVQPLRTVAIFHHQRTLGFIRPMSHSPCHRIMEKCNGGSSGANAARNRTIPWKPAGRSTASQQIGSQRARDVQILLPPRPIPLTQPLSLPCRLSYFKNWSARLFPHRVLRPLLLVTPPTEVTPLPLTLYNVIHPHLGLLTQVLPIT